MWRSEFGLATGDGRSNRLTDSATRTIAGSADARAADEVGDATTAGDLSVVRHRRQQPRLRIWLGQLECNLHVR